MPKTLNEINNNTKQIEIMTRPLVDWIPILSEECQVYQLDTGGFLAKRFSQIHYQFCDEEAARKILIDNTYEILAHKYFLEITDEGFDRIADIVNKMAQNLAFSLKTLTLNEDNVADNEKLKYITFLPDGCIAFKNGVYDFRNNKWLFKYDKINLDNGSTIVSYGNNYIIKWYFNFNFEPIEEFDISNMSLFDFIEYMKILDKEQQNYCFELVYNMCHDKDNKFSYDRFEHLCQIMGYLCLNSFTQNFVFFVGAGKNGKNSLFDGCFTNRVVPKPSTNDLQAIEDDKFITGSLEGVSHNIYLESSPKTYKDSKNLKNITGSPNQTIERKSVSKYSGIINCKFIFSANDRNETKFSDTTTGFLRRVNMLELFYTWDKNKNFLSFGDYYDTSFSADLRELTKDVWCTTTFVYLAAFGLKSATNNFTTSFDFTHNEWSSEFAEVDNDLKSSIESIRAYQLTQWARESKANADDLKNGLFSKNKQQLWRTFWNDDLQSPMFSSFNDFLNVGRMFDYQDDEGIHQDEEYIAHEYLSEAKDFYISVPLLKKYIKNFDNPKSFTLALQRLYGTNCFNKMGMNVSVIHCHINQKGFLEIIR